MNIRLKVILAITFFTLLTVKGIKSSAQTTIELPASKDSWVFSEPNNINRNFDTDPKLTLISYTYQGRIGNGRTYLYFNLDTLPDGASIIGAELKLYGYIDNQPAHVHEGDNKFTIQRVISDWDEKTITWNNQPNATTENQIFVNRTSTSPTEDYTIDVTEMLKAMIANRSSDYGIKLQFLAEQPQKQLAFTSTANPRKEKHPKLVINYTVPVQTDINTSIIDPTQYCAGDTVYISFSTKREFDTENIFSAIISDANGSFDTPTIIGSNRGTTSGTILCVLPNDLTNGSNYRIRVISSNPQQVGSPSPTLLTIKPAPVKPTITKNGNILVSNASSGNQWYDETGPIPGAIDRAFIPTRSGNYYVIVTQNGCSSRSDNFIFTGMNTFSVSQNTFNIQPNPTSQDITVKVYKQPCYIEIYNLLGVKLASYPIDYSEQKIDVSFLPKGVYALKLMVPNSSETTRHLIIN